MTKTLMIHPMVVNQRSKRQMIALREQLVKILKATRRKILKQDRVKSPMRLRKAKMQTLKRGRKKAPQ
jgi:hypothetical protein